MLQVLPFSKASKKASITLSTHGVAEMSTGSCRGSIPCTESILQALPHQFLYSQTEMAQKSLRWSFVDLMPFALGAIFDLSFTCDVIGLMLSEAS